MQLMATILGNRLDGIHFVPICIFRIIFKDLIAVIHVRIKMQLNYERMTFIAL